MNDRCYPSIRTYGLYLLAAGICLWWGCGVIWNYPEPMQPEGGQDLSFYQPTESNETLSDPDQAPLRNVILCIGDGMGVNQVSLARRRSVGEEGRLWMERLPYTGRVRTNNVKGKVTDSAAAVTAITCSVKTENGMIGMASDKTSWMSIAECLQEEGYRTGVVVTSTITHATPAGMAAHVPDRGKQADIAVQMLDAKMDVLFGGGRKYWLPKSVDGGARKDRRNLFAEAKRAGCQIVGSREQMEAVSAGRVIGLFQDDALTTIAPEPSVAEMTRAALRILTAGTPSRSEPFFLMVEGSQIDWACHNNNEAGCLRQTLLFDMAVKEVLNFAAADRQTLVLVTADHETGGLTLKNRKGAPGNVLVKWKSKNHTKRKVPLFAYGPGAEEFAGTLDNTEISVKIARLLGIEDFPRRLPEAEKAEEKSVRNELERASR